MAIGSGQPVGGVFAFYIPAERQPDSGGVPVVPIQFDAPAVTKGADLNNWTQAPALALISALFMPCLVTDFDQPVAPRSNDLSTWVHSPNPVAPGPPAIRQYDFPVPARARPDLATWTQGPNPTAPSVTLFENHDFPTPVKARPDLATWTQAPPPVAAVVVSPFGNYSFPVPQKSRPVDTWTQGFQANLQGTTLAALMPGSVVAWDVPQPPAPQPGTWTRGPQIVAAVVGSPFGNYDFPTPVKSRPDLASWTQSPAVLPAAPFRPTHFAQPGKSRPDLATWTQAPVAAAAPFALYNFPVPTRAPRPIDLATWVQNPEIAPVSYVFREPLIARPQAVRQANAALDTFVNGFRIQDQPAAASPPIRATDFAVPTKARPVDLGAWTQGFQANLQGTALAALMPGLVVGWDVPQGARPVSLQTWTQALQPTPPVAGTPVANYDFSTPKAQAKADRTWTQSPAIPPAAPFANYDLPAPRRAVNVNLTWTQSPAVLLAAPFQPIHFTQPVKARPDLATWTQIPPPVAAVVGSPFGNYDFPTPVKSRPDLASWTQSPAVVAPGAPPILQMDWPTPVKAVRSVELASWASFNINLYPPTVPPPPVFDVPPPVIGGGGPDHRIASRTWHYRSTARPVYSSTFNKVRRDLERQELEQIRASEPEPVRVLKPKFVEPIELALAKLGPSFELQKGIEAQRQREAQQHALYLKRKRDDDEAIAILLLS